PRRCSGKASSVDTTWASVDTLSQLGQKEFWELSLVSTLPGLVSTLLDCFAFPLGPSGPVLRVATGPLAATRSRQSGLPRQHWRVVSRWGTVVSGGRVIDVDATCQAVATAFPVFELSRNFSVFLLAHGARAEAWSCRSCRGRACGVWCEEEEEFFPTRRP
ncbi:hypothetical protein Taro_035342, partial [Colocasia esculenta]|nr:hypothetical protein [Colocasia esculenta]